MAYFALLYDPEREAWLRFSNPVHILAAGSLDEVGEVLIGVERLVDRGHLAAGFIAYEAAAAFDGALQTYPASDFPLAWFGVCGPDDVVEVERLPPNTSGSLPASWGPDVGVDPYAETVARIKRHIEEGDTYQVNYSFRLRSGFSGDAVALFRSLVAAQPGGYGAFFDTGRYAICSASPELFFRLSGDRITTRPMKGTRPRGRYLEEDLGLADQLRASPKDRAENLMIVDMLRNDLGRIARQGSVHVPSLFDVERHPTVWQMTSSVTAETDAGWPEIVSALFPCASVTGAPKASTMGIIRDLESGPRNVYTGAIGYLAPERRAQFNVAIRTVLIDRKAGTAEYGVGSGVVWDSDTPSEYQECLTKARVLTERKPDFHLLETIRWGPGERFFLLERHLDRLSASAAYFGFVFDRSHVFSELEGHVSTISRQPHRVRLTVDAAGRPQVESAPIASLRDSSEALYRVRPAARQIDSSDRFLFHKTTFRDIYERARASAPDCEDVLLWNEREELTESSIANLFVRLGDAWYTPPVDCGLLAGTFRAEMLATGRVVERVIRVAELGAADELALGNSVRGWWSVELAR